MKELSIQRGKYLLNGLIENEGQDHIVILVHGFTGDFRGPQDIFILLSEALQRQGYSVCRYNSIGTPPSEGEFQNMTLWSEVEDLESVIKKLQTQGYKKISLLGESMGGAVITLIDTMHIQNMIFWYPAFDFSDSDFTDEFLSKSARKELDENNYVMCDGFKVGEKFISEITDINLFENLKNIKNPSLLLHGDKDKEVPYQQSKKAYNILTGIEKEVHILPGAGHCFKNEQEEAIERTILFMKNHS